MEIYQTPGIIYICVTLNWLWTFPPASSVSGERTVPSCPVLRPVTNHISSPWWWTFYGADVTRVVRPQPRPPRPPPPPLWGIVGGKHFCSVPAKKRTKWRVWGCVQQRAAPDERPFTLATDYLCICCGSWMKPYLHPQFLFSRFLKHPWIWSLTLSPRCGHITCQSPVRLRVSGSSHAPCHSTKNSEWSKD